MSDNPYDRPLIVTILGVLYALVAIVCLFAGIALAVGGDALIDEMIKQDSSLDALQGLGLGLGVAFIVLGIIYGVICYGFMHGWSIMWYLGVIFTILSILGSLISVAIGGLLMIVPLVVDVVILLYLFKPNVKMFFLKHA